MEEGCWTGCTENFDAMSNTDDQTENTDIKHDANFNVTTNTFKKLKEIRKKTFDKKKKLRLYKSLTNSAQQFRFHCTLCKTSYSSNT